MRNTPVAGLLPRVSPESRSPSLGASPPRVDPNSRAHGASSVARHAQPPTRHEHATTYVATATSMEDRRLASGEEEEECGERVTSGGIASAIVVPSRHSTAETVPSRRQSSTENTPRQSRSLRFSEIVDDVGAAAASTSSSSPRSQHGPSTPMRSAMRSALKLDPVENNDARGDDEGEEGEEGTAGMMRGLSHRGVRRSVSDETLYETEESPGAGESSDNRNSRNGSLVVPAQFNMRKSLFEVLSEGDEHKVAVKAAGKVRVPPHLIWVFNPTPSLPPSLLSFLSPSLPPSRF